MTVKDLCWSAKGEMRRIKIKIFKEGFEAKDPIQIEPRSLSVSTHKAYVSILWFQTLDKARLTARKQDKGVQGNHFSSCLQAGGWEEDLQWRM